MAAPVELTTEQHVARIRSSAQVLAADLLAANEAGVPHAIVLPQLMLVFRETFGTMPDLPGLGAMLGGAS